MQLFAIFNELRRRPRLVGIALIVSVLLGLMVGFKISPGLPPHLTSRQHEVGVASTRVLINTPSSIVADLNPAGGNSLSTHAQLLGNLLSSDQVHNAIAKSAGLRAEQVTISPLAVGGVIQTPLAVTAPAAVGASSVSVNADPLLPLITINATAPTPKLAAALANGSVSVLQSYIQTVAAQEGIPASRRPVITSLGAAVGLPSISGPSKTYSAIAIILLFGIACYVILIATGGKARLRELRELRAIERERALAMMHATDPSAAPYGPADPAPSYPPEAPASGSLDHLREFDAGAGLLTIGDDLGRARAYADRAPTVESRADSAHADVSRAGPASPDTIWTTHASPHYRGARAVPSNALLRRFSRS
jgi:hypothetical protein